ncbi:GTP cyclohydrolase II [Aliishimia ponticola]|uniref:GTP cyclohydrolase-2 n=1 Tax=Aliishimia ponticola TaxID=2499833 RepID=A0A4S4NES2_9RHOB|nr:GTP cyclohydrolase II [Aliishimia ponticola]THH36628.1 GTP cyclohydrolase II [Aliishimia ponticola]
MTFAPDLNERLARARADLRMGLPVVLEGAQPMLAFAAETISEQRLAGVQAMTPDAVIAITDHRARVLKAAAYDGDLARIELPPDARLPWVLGVADPADDLKTPMKGPLIAQRGGDAAAHRAALHLVKSARLLPAALLCPSPSIGFATQNDLTRLPLAQVIPALAAPNVLAPVVSARLPLSVSEAGRLHVFRPEDGGEEHYAVEIGRPDRDKPVLARLHSACFTGDVLGSLKCDCGPQLHGALAQMGQEGAGVLLYLNQEGRGIGLANKMRAYSLQDQGFDTVEANHRLGFEDDERDFRLGADILARMGFSKVRLLTNNPAKIAMMENCGISVTERVPLKVGQTPQNAGYLATKMAKSGHLL